MTRRIVLVEPWYGGSHRAWADAYQDASEHVVRIVAHPGSFWRWRLRGAAVTLAEALHEDRERHGPPDVFLVSGMVDLAQLRGLMRPPPTAPVALVLHENQVAYPHADAVDLDAAWRTWTSLLAADLVIINSVHHREVLLAGLERLLATSPDLGHGHLLETVVERIVVVPVGVVLPEARQGRSSSGPPVVLWNHRWDDDKKPEVFVRAVESLMADGMDLHVVLAGEDHWQGQPRRRAAAERLGAAVLAEGPFDRETYLSWLGRSDVVVSVADHEFFGMAVIEAIAAGCVPVLPDALAYPEMIPERFHPAVLYPVGSFRTTLARVVGDIDAARRRVVGLADAMAVFDHRRVATTLDSVLEDLVARHR